MNKPQDILPKEIPLKIAKALKEHVPLHVLNDYLKHFNKPTSRSWDEVLAKNCTESDFFQNLLTEITCFGRKSIFAYDARDADLSLLNNLEYKESDVIQALEISSKSYQLFRRDIGERYEAYSFIRKEPAVEIYALTQNDLTPDARNKFWSPSSEIKLKTNVMVTVFQSLIYDQEEKILYVLIDNLRYSFDEAFDSDFSIMTTELNLLFGSVIDAINHSK